MHPAQASQRLFHRTRWQRHLSSRRRQSFRRGGKAHTRKSVHLLSFLQGVVRLSCSETPAGSRPTFVVGKVSPIHPITGWPWLAPASPTCRPIGLSYDALSLAGGRQVYHVPRAYQSGEGPALTPVVQHLREETAKFLDLTTYHFGSSLSASLACPELRRLQRFTYVDQATHS